MGLRRPRLAGMLGAAVLALWIPAAAESQAPTSDELPVAALLAPFRAAEGRTVAHVWLEVPGPEALAATSSGGSLSLSVEIVAPPGRIETSFSHSFDLADAGARDALSRASLRLHGAAALAPGSYTLSYRVRHGGKDLAERNLPFDIQPFKADHAAVLPPFFVDEYGLDDVDDGLARRADDNKNGTDPFVTAAEESFVPDVVPVVERGERARLVLAGYHLLREQSLLEAILTTAEGHRLGKDRLALIRRHEDESGLERLDFALQTEGLAPGEYQLEVSIQDLKNGLVDQTLMPFTIR